MNPFTNRVAIKNPDDFFGREEQIAEILARLRTMQSSSVVGERRIGKSSLLYHLGQTGTRRLDDPSYRFFYLDLEDAHYHTALGFFQTVLSKLGLAAEAITAENTLNRNLIAFTDQLEALEQAGQRVILCLDEFEITFKHREQFPEDFFDHLRAQLNLCKLACVTATRRSLQALSLEGRLTSPFYNVFTVIELKEFTELEAQQFIAAHHERVSFTDDELKFIFSYLDPHPLKLQILCDWVMKNRQRQLAEWALVEEIGKEYSNFLVGTFDLKQFRKAKKALRPENINKWLETIKTVKNLFSGSDKK